MKDTIKIHETAFVTATYRASNEELSKDKYSSYWKNPKTDKWITNYLEKVSVDEPFTHCLRNRFFYETIKTLVKQHEIEVLINFGCGFSMYPFLYESSLVNIEIDHKDIIDYKKSEVQRLMDEGKLPKRKIHYIATDFNLEIGDLEDEIKSITNGRPSFVLLEGVLFFLSKPTTDELIELISSVQTVGSYFGSVSFLDGIEDTACFNRLINFFKKEVVLNNKFEYLTLPISYYESLPAYKLIEHEDYVALSKKFSPMNAIDDADSILNEHMYVLQRK